uniref:Uncharacterized protein n=1 Tax=Escherichia coli TaxID=562 RepID=A0A890DJZ5_ECOLX|nr:hypothetical protein [Escherichia coli]
MNQEITSIFYIYISLCTFTFSQSHITDACYNRAILNIKFSYGAIATSDGRDSIH